MRGNHGYLLKFPSIGRLPLVTEGPTVLRGWPAPPPPWVMGAGRGFSPCCLPSSHLCHRWLACHLPPGLCFRLVPEQCGATRQSPQKTSLQAFRIPFLRGRHKTRPAGSSSPLGCAERTAHPQGKPESPRKGGPRSKSPTGAPRAAVRARGGL